MSGRLLWMLGGCIQLLLLPSVRCSIDGNITMAEEEYQPAKSCDDKDNPCTDICHNRPGGLGFVCSCPFGKKLASDNVTCTKEIPARLCKMWGICGQNCSVDNTAPHGYKCTCFPGFFLEPDEFTCKPIGSDPVYMVFSNRHEIRRLDILSGSTTSLIWGLRNTIALDYYYNEHMQAVLFWTDATKDKMYSGTMVGNNIVNVQSIMDSVLSTTEDISVDWVAGNIYWVDSNLDQIGVSKLNGQHRMTLISGDMTNPRAIVVDPQEAALFWTDLDRANPRIEGASMSGENRSIIYSIDPKSGVGWPNGLTVDYDFKRLYWIDAQAKSIHTINYEGRDHRLILKSHKDISHPFSLSLFGNYVYWTDWKTKVVLKANKFNGSDVQIVQHTIMQPFDIQIVHPKRQDTTIPNACGVDNGGCSHLCLLDYGGKSGCQCPPRMRLDETKKKCVSLESDIHDDDGEEDKTKANNSRIHYKLAADYNGMPMLCGKPGERPTAIDSRYYRCKNGKPYLKGLDLPDNTSPSPHIDDTDECSYPITCQGINHCGTPFTKCCRNLTYDPGQQTCCKTTRYKAKIHDGKRREHVCCGLDAYAIANLEGIPCRHPIQNNRFWTAKQANPRRLARQSSKYDHAYIAVFQKRNGKTGYNVDALSLNITKGHSENAGVAKPKRMTAPTDKRSPRKNLRRNIFLVFSHTTNPLDEFGDDLILGQTDTVLRLPFRLLLPRRLKRFRKLLKAGNISFKQVRKFLKV